MDAVTERLREDDLRIAAEAARWHRALERGGAEERAEFAAWVKASPRHLREFLFMEALEAAAENIDPERRMELQTDFAEAENNVVALREGGEGNIAERPHRRLSAGAWLVAAAAASVMLALAWWQIPEVLGGWQRYATSIGEQRTIELEDGSVLQLNAQSRVRVRFSPRSRDIRLLDGEALFNVAHDATRPFRVHTEDAVIRAVGTQFDVYRRSGDTTVSVLEGRVEIVKQANKSADAVPHTDPASGTAGAVASEGAVMKRATISDSPTQLSAGEAAHIQRNGVIKRVTVVDVADATAWRQRRLVFREESLGQIAAEFNRYNRTPQIRVEGETVRARRYGGTFDADDPESLIKFVTRKGDLQIERETGRIVIRER